MNDKIKTIEGLVNELLNEPTKTPQLGSAISELRAAAANLAGHQEAVARLDKPEKIKPLKG